MRAPRALLRSATVALLWFIACAAALAGTTQSFTFTAKSYTGSRDRQYKVYVPDGAATPVPMVMALHGCQQTNDDVLNDWGLKAAADRFRFILVAPFITSYDGLRNTNCWGFWFDEHRHQGAGEVQDLRGIAEEVEKRFSVDARRRYIAGLSSGAAMVVDAAVAHNEYWAAAASASGVPYGEDAAAVSLSGQCPGFATFHSVGRVVADMRKELDNRYPIPLMVLQNDGDCTVLAAAARNLRDAHLKVFGDAAHDTPSAARAAAAACTPVFQVDYGCEHVRYTQTGATNARSIVETVFYNGPRVTPNPNDTDHGHYWIGGERGNDGRWSLRRGPSYPEIVWDFFSRHPREAGGAAGVPTIMVKGDNPMRVSVGAPFVDPGAAANDPEDGPLTVQADCSSVDTSRAGQYTCTYKATDSAGNTATATRTVIVSNATVTCRAATSTPAGHVAAAHATVSGFWLPHAISTGDHVDIGAVWNGWTAVTLYEREPGRWYARKPAECGA